MKKKKKPAVDDIPFRARYCSRKSWRSSTFTAKIISQISKSARRPDRPGADRRRTTNNRQTVSTKSERWNQGTHEGLFLRLREEGLAAEKMEIIQFKMEKTEHARWGKRREFLRTQLPIYEPGNPGSRPGDENCMETGKKKCASLNDK